jgi:hypothetical protein
LLRTEPKYLAQAAKFVTFAKTDDFVDLVFSLFSDVFLVKEELLVLNLLKQLICSLDSREFENPTELLRQNTLPARLLSEYSKRQSGKLYLNYCLRDTIVGIISSQESCEIDPEKVWFFDPKLNEFRSCDLCLDQLQTWTTEPN